MKRRQRWRRSRTGTYVGGNRVELLHDGEEIFPAMLDAIRSAEREVLLEMYWFDSDDTGRRFAGALAEHAARGVKVRVIYDGIGSLEADRAMFEEMREAGCEVYEYHPFLPWNPRFKLGRLNNRDHRKLLVIDGVYGMTGGINLADLWASADDGGYGFRDDMIVVEGPAVAHMRDVFYRTYRYLAPGSIVADPLPACGSRGDCRVAVLANDFRGERRVIRGVYLDHIRRAVRRITITNSYFLPDRGVRRALADAVERGVEVRVMLPTHGDVAAVRYATRNLYDWLMRCGIQVFEWGQSILHSKTAVIDDDWCTVGTHNLDYRSWALNLEVNVAVRDAGVAGRLQRRMERDLAESVPLDRHNWKYRPLSERLLEIFFYRFRRWL